MRSAFLIFAGWLWQGFASAQVDPLLIKLNCQICHQPGLSSSLQNKSEETILSDLKHFKSGQRPSLIMHRLVKGLTDEELRQVAKLVKKQSHGDR